MTRKSIGEYPPDWKQIADKTKDEAGWKCIRCDHQHDPKKGYCLTVHHLDIDPSNCRWWNLVALCQKCHLTIQAKVVLEQQWVLEHSDWFKPYAAGWYAWKYLGQDLSRDEVMARLEELLSLERVI
jgi:hypothetical protein